MGQRLVVSIHVPGMDKVIVNCYQHWSAYTGSAINNTEDLINAYNDWKAMNEAEAKELFKKTDDASRNRQMEVLAMVMMDAWPGAMPTFHKNDGFPEYDYDNDPEAPEKHSTDIKRWMLSKGMFELASRMKDKIMWNRNEGLIGMTENEITDTQNWSEGDVDIYINEDGNIESICFGVVWVQDWDEALADIYLEDGEDESEREKQLLDDLYETDDVDGSMEFTLSGWDEFIRLYNQADDAGKCKMGSKKTNTVVSFIG